MSMLCLRGCFCRPVLSLGFFVLGLCVFLERPARAETCTLLELTEAADEVGASLRRFNDGAMPKVRAKMQQLRLNKGWSDKDYRELAADYLHDARMAGYDEKANTLFRKIDDLSPSEENQKISCSRVTELRASGLELLAVMKAKSAHTIAKIDAVVKPKAPPTTTAKATPKPKPAPAAVAELKKPSRAAPNTSDLEGAGKPNVPTSPTVLRPDRERAEASGGPVIKDAPSNGDVAMRAPPRVPEVTPTPWETDTTLVPGVRGATKTYSIEEIRDASRGFFGTISTHLASVLEHAFKNLGQPTAYVLGNEGGGAFLAGLRYGDGTLYLRAGGRRKVYWHGPSVGYDFGASGTRTMFLIYKLNRPEDLFRSFTGIDGSAFLVGGVGITLLKGGSVVMAPIRSGIGLRIGASVGYVRFTPNATWNPF